MHEGATALEGPERILVVDDEAPVRRLLGRWLREAGYPCAEAEDHRSAWDYLQSHPVELVASDIKMPGQDGFHLLRDIRRGLPDVSVIMVTALGDTSRAIRALTHGAASYLIKPIDRDSLLSHVRRNLKRRRRVIQRRQQRRKLEAMVHEQMQRARQAHEELILRLISATACRDEETGGHIHRTGLYSELMAEAICWPDDAIEHIRLAAPMHDVGKIGIPDAILRKPGKLSSAEFEIMKSHTTIGANLLAGSHSPVLRMAQQIALCHHERWDGTGYPSGLRADEIPECARIVAIVDVYDALTHDRPYRAALSEDEALQIIERGRGSHFDEFLLDVFLSLLPEMRRIAQEQPALAPAAADDPWQFLEQCGPIETLLEQSVTMGEPVP